MLEVRREEIYTYTHPSSVDR